MRINRRTLGLLGLVPLAVVVAVACNRGDEGVVGPSKIEAPATVSAPSSVVVDASSNDLWISEEDRKWFKQHVPKFSVEGTVVTVEGRNPWDHPVQQGHAKQFWLKLFDKTDPSQPFIGQAGPFTIGAKDSFSASVDMGYGYCFVEAELRLDSADNHANGGQPNYLFGVENLDIGDCHKPKTGPSCQVIPVPEPSPSPSPDGEVNSSAQRELPACDLCDNIEGYQGELPIAEDGRPYTRVFDEETGLFLCTPPVQLSCEEINPPTTGSGSATKSSEEHPGTPGTPTLYFYDFNFSDLSSSQQQSIRDKCENEGGDFFSSIDGRSNVCRTPVNHGNDWDPGVKSGNDDEGERYKTLSGTPSIPTKYSLTVTADYSFTAGDGGTFNVSIVFNGAIVKKTIQVSLECGEKREGSFTWGPGDPLNSSPNYQAGDGHLSGTYTVVITPVV